MADSNVLFTLFESAAGYALFEVVAFDEIGGLLDDSMDTVCDLKRFGRAVKLKAFYPFESAAEALENANAVSEHAMTGTLHNFLEMNLPKISKSSKKTAPFSLGVIDPALATAIMEGLSGITCRSDDTIREIGRGCRMHLETFVKGLAGDASTKAQLGLGHSYSRSKVKFNPARSDNMIIQSIALLDQLDKDVNTFAMRVREWYSWHFPELKEICKDNIMFARAAALIQDKNTLFHSSADHDDEHMDNGKDKLAALAEIVGDQETAELIVAAAKTSMGMDCSAIDMINIVNFTQRMVKMAEYRKQLSLYLSEKMSVVAPNLSALIGDSVAARLISKVRAFHFCECCGVRYRRRFPTCFESIIHLWSPLTSLVHGIVLQAGSLTNLAKAPASTVQILGAEKALFRALKTKGNTPKYGLIYHSTFIGRADAKNKGRISRYLANKCSIATRIDSFSDEPNSLYGEKLRDQVEERLKFYETGAAPRRNIDVMEEVAKELKAGKGEVDVEMEEPSTDKKKKKKDKKRKSMEVDDEDDDDDKKKRKSIDVDADAEDEDDDKAAKKSAKKAKKDKKKKKKSM
jgi:nucleolar protein 56